MKLIITAALLLVSALPMLAQNGTALPVTLADITGDAATHKFSATAVSAKWILIIPLSTNSAVVRIGDSATSASRGAAIAAGGGLLITFQPDQRNSEQDYRMNLANLYYYAASGDKISVMYVK